MNKIQQFLVIYFQCRVWSICCWCFSPVHTVWCLLLFLYLEESLSFKLLPCPTKTCFLHPLSDPSFHYEYRTQSNNLRSCRTALLPQAWLITNWFSYQHLKLIWWPQDVYHMSYRHKGSGRTDSISRSESNFSQWSFSKAVWGHGMDLDGSHHLAPSDTLWLHINCILSAVVKDSCS